MYAHFELHNPVIIQDGRHDTRITFTPMTRGGLAIVSYSIEPDKVILVYNFDQVRAVEIPLTNIVSLMVNESGATVFEIHEGEE